MRVSLVRRVLLTASLVVAGACESSTSPSATLTLTTAPDFTGTVAKSAFESANGPAGPYAQYDIWVIVPPGSSANVGVVLPLTAPVFVQSGAGLVRARGSDIRVGDRIRVWRNPDFAAYGAVQGPPGAPTYEGRQVVILR